MACESEQSAVKAAQTALSDIIKRDKINYFKTDAKVIKQAQQRVSDAKSALSNCKSNTSKQTDVKKSTMYKDGGFLEGPTPILFEE